VLGEVRCHTVDSLLDQYLHLADHRGQHLKSEELGPQETPMDTGKMVRCSWPDHQEKTRDLYNKKGLKG
jgi:hypothetical protein